MRLGIPEALKGHAEFFDHQVLVPVLVLKFKFSIRRIAETMWMSSGTGTYPDKEI
eukprot:SAG31_NODE_23310_length_506_cov_3.830467_1_plen_54_part_01